MLHRAVATLCAGLMASTPALACTDVRLIAGDGSPMTVRTMEFAADLGSQAQIVPRNMSFTSPGPTGDGVKWSSKYGYVAMNAWNYPAATDGLNEKGLGFGALYLPGETKYQDVAKGDEARALSNARFGNWVLGNFASAEEVRDALKGVVVWGEIIPQLGSFSPLHYVVHDATGKSIVIEFVDGKAQVHDGAAGVLTNSPTYDWHIQNLRNYVNLTPVNAAPVKLGNATYTGMGQGSGLHGLPGDPSPPSRFVMAAASAFLADRPKDSAEALIVAQHIINRVDIPKGLVRDYSQGGKPTGDYTQWTTFRDHANKVYYWKTYNDPGLRAVDLKQLDFSPGQPMRSLSIAAAKPTVQMVSTRDFAAETQ